MVILLRSTLRKKFYHGKRYFQLLQPMFLWREWRGDIIHLLQPHLDFLAPEYVLTQHCGAPSDMFSLGLLIYAVFAKGMTFLQCNGQLSSYKKNAEKVSLGGKEVTAVRFWFSLFVTSLFSKTFTTIEVFWWGKGCNENLFMALYDFINCMLTVY